jgi:hypothetical protein
MRLPRYPYIQIVLGLLVVLTRNTDFERNSLVIVIININNTVSILTLPT